ncbi:glutathione S-transferase [Photobacterium chitinilyticum]|uniref:Glutathione S-transferase n=1 Tax=Photobacterium chitinilyticum TaxID=2485123 RepID=A0A3S3R8A6_9GAMM|nr:glutathione S-transferase [Photobacterium chitinilyticum]RWX54744.1 glutathione S-transferase [Photobacterium chitinilyticum]
MKIYELGPAPSARRVSIFLAEKGIEVERQHIDIRGGENLSEDFKAKSLNGQIPVLELDDGTTICESVAICRYFDEAYPTEYSLFGNNALEKAQVEMWQRLVELRGLLVAMQAFRNISGIYQDRENCIAEWGEESRQRLIEFIPTLDKQLAVTPYIAGNNFSIADITTVILCDFIQNLEIQIDDSLPNLQRWYQHVSERPSIKA